MSPNRFLRDLIVVLICAGCAIWGVTRWLVRPFIVSGPSMQPTLYDGDRVLVDLTALKQRLPRPGELVVLLGPDDVDLVKRVAREPYPANAPYPEAAIAADSQLEPCFIVLGDNPSESLDSRAFGRIPQHRIQGRVIWRYWPLTRVGSIE